jgi:hypothetical protein
VPDRSSNTQSVTIVYADADAATAARLTQSLVDAGITVVPPSVSEPTDGIVVLMSAGALRDPVWRHQAASSAAGRLVPVRIGELDDKLVPEPLKRPNWIDWNAEHPASSTGSVLAGVLADPARRRLSRQLTHEAEAWAAGGRPAGLLMADYRRAVQMNAMLVELEADPLAAPGTSVLDFVRASLTATRRRHRKRRRRRVAAAVVILIAVSTASVTLPKIAAAGRSNRQAIVTAGDQAFVSELPEWSAANAGALLLNGTPAERLLARNTLLQALGEPWRINALNFIGNLTSIAPFDRGSRAVVLGSGSKTTSVAILALPAGRVLGSTRIPGAFGSVSVSPDGRIALIGGVGLEELDLATGRLKLIDAHQTVADVRALAYDRALIASPAGQLDMIDLVTDHYRLIGRYRSVLDLQATGSGGVGLVVEPTGRPALVDAVSGKIRASSAVALAASPQGAISPDGARALVTGADGQLWQLGAGGARPTGVALPYALTSLAWAADDRIVLASDDQHATVVYLPRAEPIGSVCTDVVALGSVAVDPSGQTVACLGAETSLWRLPDAPATPAGYRFATSPSAASSLANVTTRGAEVNIHFGRASGPGETGWFDPLNATISASSFSPAGDELVVGSRQGGAAVVGLAPGHARIVETWSSPDGSPIVGVGWRAGPVAQTASGQVWNVPDCQSCARDVGLLVELRRRETGCLTARQLSFMDTTTWRRLGLQMCPPRAPLGHS